MSMVGPSVIVKKSSDSDGDEAPDFNAGRPGSIEFSQLVGEDHLSVSAPYSMTKLSCGNADCTSISETTESVLPFSQRAMNLVTKSHSGLNESCRKFYRR